MFTNKKAKYYGDNKVLLDSACLSSDTKPTTGVANGSKCIEMDTGKTYMFNEEDSEWEELPSSGGGGGSSDFSTATVEYSSSANGSITIACISPDDSTVMPFINPGSATLSFTVPLYKNHSQVNIEATNDLPITVSTTGNVTYSGDEYSGICDITGDCSITIS